MFGMTRGGRKQDQERIDAFEKALERLVTAVSRNGAAIDNLESGEKKIRLEWEDVYDRVTRTMGRLNARIRKAEATESDEQEPQQGKAPEVQATGTHAILSAYRKRRQ